MSNRYDAIVIGTGQSGPPLVDRMAEQGMKVAVIERGRFGGTCVNTGCTPTKTLVASARAAHVARTSANYGVMINSEIFVDMKKVKERKDLISGASSNYIEEWLEGLDNVTVYKGHASFLSPNEVAVNDVVIRSEKIFINVGTRAYVPPDSNSEGLSYFTNSSILDVDFIPEHLVVIGGSYIGLEFGQMYRRFGSEVTIIEKSPRLIAREDQDVSETVYEILENEGINIRLDADCIYAKKHQKGVEVQIKCPGGDASVLGSHVLWAVGRIPNIDDLGLDTAGVSINKMGYINVDDNLKTNVEGIWAIGDCNGKGAFTHTSYNDFEIVSANLFDNDPRKVSDRIICYALYIDPPLGRIGMTEAEVRSSGRKALVAKRMMSRVARAREKGETHGFMKVLVDAESKEILGATILGIEGDEAIHAILDVMYAKAPYTVIQRAVHIHPTVSELIPTMLGSLEPLD